MVKEVTIPIKNITNSKRELFKNIVNILSPIFKTTERENELLIYIIEEVDLYLSQGYNLIEASKLSNSRKSRKKVTEKMGFQPAIYRQMVWKLRLKKVLGQENDPHPLYLTYFKTIREEGDTLKISFNINLPKSK